MDNQDTKITKEWIDQQRGRMGKRLTYDNGCGHGILCASKCNGLSAGCVLCCNEICEQHRREHGGNCGGCAIQLAFDALAEHETVLPAALDALEASIAREAEKDATIEEQAKRIKFLEDHILRITPTYKKIRDKLLDERDRLTADRDAEKRRADAAVHDLKLHPCYSCNYNGKPEACKARCIGLTGNCHEWRGPCAANTEAPTGDGEREERK